MRVMCINDKWVPTPAAAGCNGPSLGEVDIVIEERISFDGVRYYLLERFPDLCFAQSNFAPCSDIDETELVNKKEEYEPINS